MRVIVICFISIFLTTVNVSAKDLYFPLDENITWTYIIKADGSAQDEKMVINTLPKKNLLGTILTPRQIEKGDTKALEFFIEDEEGVYVYAAQKSVLATPEKFENPYYYIRKPYRIGTTWEDYYTTKHMMEPVELPVKVSIQSLDETVTVPAGIFHNCMKLIRKGEIDENHGEYFGNSKVIVEENLWYAPGVGLVKLEFNEVSNHKMSGPGHGMTLLESYKVKPNKKTFF